MEVNGAPKQGYTECYILKPYRRDKEEKQLDRFSFRNSTEVWNKHEINMNEHQKLSCFNRGKTSKHNFSSSSPLILI